MTKASQETRQGFFWRQQHLSPLPIPTGQAPSDLLNLIWRKTPVYLDIGSFPMGSGWLTLHAMTFVIVAVSVWAAWSFYGVRGVSWYEYTVLPVTGAVIVGPLWYLYIKQWRKPLTPPIRFNRQRREVCITEPDGSYWFVPWERVHAIAPSVLMLNSGGASKHGSLVLWFPLKGQEHEDYAPDKPGWVMMVNPGGGRSAMAQWECIRSFIEVGAHAVPDSRTTEHAELTEREGYWGAWKDCTLQFFDELRAKEFGRALASLSSLTIFGLPWISVLFTRKLANLPDLTAPDVIEWSQPLPPEQWAKRSPELERAISEREAELVAQA